MLCQSPGLKVLDVPITDNRKHPNKVSYMSDLALTHIQEMLLDCYSVMEESPV